MYLLNMSLIRFLRTSYLHAIVTIFKQVNIDDISITLSLIIKITCIIYVSTFISDNIVFLFITMLL